MPSCYDPHILMLRCYEECYDDIYCCYRSLSFRILLQALVGDFLVSASSVLVHLSADVAPVEAFLDECFGYSNQMPYKVGFPWLDYEKLSRCAPFLPLPKVVNGYYAPCIE
jgi:hypothetical protein